MYIGKRRVYPALFICFCHKLNRFLNKVVTKTFNWNFRQSFYILFMKKIKVKEG